MQRIKWPLLVAMVAGSFGMLNQPAVAEGSRWKEELSREIVRSERGTFKIEEFSLCTITPRWGGEGKRIQFRSSAQGPANLISRDFLVRSFADYEARVVSELSRDATMRCKTIDAAIGTVDVELNLLITSEGIQWEMTENSIGRQERTTRAWAEIYPD